MIVVDVENLSKDFKNEHGIVNAVHNLNLKISRGNIFGFLGPNGAGKTTTLRMLATLIIPTYGRAVVAGIDLLKSPKLLRKKIGYVGQMTGCDREISPKENLILQGRLYGMSKANAISRSQEIIHTFELESFCNRKIKTLSGGQIRRVDLGMAMMHKPDLLFLDEPTSGLDPQSRAFLWTELRELRKQGLTILMTTHYLDEADSVCDYVSIIDHGSIVAEGTPNELKQKISGDILTLGMDMNHDNVEKVKFIFSQKSFINKISSEKDSLRLYVNSGEAALPEVIQTMLDANLIIQSLNLTRPSLEEVFLTKTGRSLRDN